MNDSDRSVSQYEIKEGDSVETNITELKDINEGKEEDIISIKNDFLQNDIFNSRLNKCISENIKNNICNSNYKEEISNSKNYKEEISNDYCNNIMIDKNTDSSLNQSEYISIKQDFLNNEANNKIYNNISYDNETNNNKNVYNISYDNETNNNKNVYNIIGKNFNDIKKIDEMFIDTKDIDNFFCDIKKSNINYRKSVKSSPEENSSVFSESYATLEIMSNIKERIKIIEKDVYKYLNIDQIEEIKTKVRKILNKQHFQRNRRIKKPTDITDCSNL